MAKNNEAPLAPAPAPRKNSKGAPPAAAAADAGSAGNYTQRPAKKDEADFNMKMPSDWKFQADLFIKMQRMSRKDYIRQLIETEMAKQGFTPGQWD